MQLSIKHRVAVDGVERKRKGKDGSVKGQTKCFSFMGKWPLHEMLKPNFESSVQDDRGDEQSALDG